MLVTVIQFYGFHLYIHLHSVYNLEPDVHAQKSTTWLRSFLILSRVLAWFDYFTLEIVRREASKVWTRYNGETIFGPERSFSKTDDRVPHAWISNSPLHLVLAFQSLANVRSHTIHRLVRPIICLEEWKVVGRLRRLKSVFFHTRLISTCHLPTCTVCVWALCGRSLRNCTNWRCYASHEWGGKKVVLLKLN